VCWTQSQCRVVALLRVLHVALLLQRVRQVAVRVREVRLQLDRATVRVNRQVNQPAIVKGKDNGSLIFTAIFLPAAHL